MANRRQLLRVAAAGSKLLDAQGARRNYAASIVLGAMVGMPNAFAIAPMGAKLVADLRPEQSEAMLASPQEPAATVISPEVAAQKVRQQIVEFASAQFGPSLLNDWNHPSNTYPTQADTFVLAYVRLMQLALSAKRPDEIVPSNAKDALTNASGAFRFLTKILGQTLGPAGDLIDSAASEANRGPGSSSLPSTMFEAHLREVQAVAQQLLSPADYEAYVRAAADGDYATQTSILFKMNYELLSRQPVVNPYILWWCDMRGGDGRAGSRPLFDFPDIAPGDDRFTQHIWNNFTLVERWNAVDDALKRWFLRTSATIADPTQRIALLASVKTQSEEKRRGPALGPDAAQQNREIVAALGPQALDEYTRANAADKGTLLKTATLFVEGVNSLLPMLMGVPSLRVDGTLAPLAERP